MTSIEELQKLLERRRDHLGNADITAEGHLCSAYYAPDFIAGFNALLPITLRLASASKLVLEYLVAVESDLKEEIPNDHKGCTSFGHTALCGALRLTDDTDIDDMKKALAELEAFAKGEK
jgi:hypothetical protein